jgi:uncharacterized protein (TIGR00369 family)
MRAAGATGVTSAAGAPDAGAAVPEGFVALAMGGDFMACNGPLYRRWLGRPPVAGELAAPGAAPVVQLGFRVEARHTNPAGICHGGMMASFCDMLLPVCAHHRSPELARRFLPTVSLQVDYLAPAPLGAWVQGEAEVLRVTRSLAFLQGLVTADGEPVARASGVFKIGPVFDRAPRA